MEGSRRGGGREPTLPIIPPVPADEFKRNLELNSEELKSLSVNLAESKSEGLTFTQKVELVRLFMELRDPLSGALGMVGMLETRNLLARLFPDFDAVRDPELDDDIRQLAVQAHERYSNPDQLQL